MLTSSQFYLGDQGLVLLLMISDNAVLFLYIVMAVEDGCCPFKIVFDEDLYVVFDEDFYVLSMYLCFTLSMS